jgi:hypothetical protein
MTTQGTELTFNYVREQSAYGCLPDISRLDSHLAKGRRHHRCRILGSGHDPKADSGLSVNGDPSRGANSEDLVDHFKLCAIARRGEFRVGPSMTSSF